MAQNSEEFVTAVSQPKGTASLGLPQPSWAPDPREYVTSGARGNNATARGIPYQSLLPRPTAAVTPTGTAPEASATAASPTTSSTTDTLRYRPSYTAYTVDSEGPAFASVGQRPAIRGPPSPAPPTTAQTNRESARTGSRFTAMELESGDASFRSAAELIVEENAARRQQRDGSRQPQTCRSGNEEDVETFADPHFAASFARVRESIRARPTRRIDAVSSPRAVPRTAPSEAPMSPPPRPTMEDTNSVDTVDNPEANSNTTAQPPQNVVEEAARERFGQAYLRGAPASVPAPASMSAPMPAPAPVPRHNHSVRQSLTESVTHGQRTAGSGRYMEPARPAAVPEVRLSPAPRTGPTRPSHQSATVYTARYPSWPYHRIERATETSFEVDHLYFNPDGTPRQGSWTPGESRGNTTPAAEIHARLMTASHLDRMPVQTYASGQGAAQNVNFWDVNTWCLPRGRSDIPAQSPASAEDEEVEMDLEE
ncbi:hypothetical protein V8F20_008626 [Naviculisporaceae sp. PSN 640]